MLVLSATNYLPVVLGQNLSNLDTKYGINQFKLESSFSKYQSQLKFQTEDNGVKFYSCKNVSSIRIFEEEVSDVTLGFYKNKLYTISVYLWTLLPERQMKVLSKLENLFGNAALGNDRSTSYKLEWAYVWQTPKTYLAYVKHPCNSKIKPCFANIYIISRKMETEIASDQF